jgi:hypothetical protein
MAIKKTIRKAGRPEAAGMSSETIKNKIEWEITKANKNAANNLGKYFAQLEEYALGKGSDTNTVSSCRFFIEMAQKYLEENVEEGVEGEEEEQVTIKQVGNGSNVVELSYPEKLAAYKALQAEKV